jgi:hypothetical protein
MFKGVRYAAFALLALAMVAGAFAATPAYAQYPTFSSGIQVQNLGTSTAQVTFSFYEENATGDPAYTLTTSINANSQKTYATLDTAGVGAGFQGSAVLSSDQKIAAIVNLVGADFGGEAYVGVEGGANDIALPFLTKGFFSFNAFFNVQNVGSSATNVEVTYSGNGISGTVTDSYSNLQPGASHRFDLAATSSIPAGFNGSATINCPSSECAAVVTLVSNKTVQVYNGFASGSTNPSFPLINTNNFGFTTGIALQNFGTQSTEVTVSYGDANGEVCTETQTIAPKAVEYFAINAFLVNPPASYTATENCPNGQLFVGAGRVTTNSTNQSLVGIVNQNSSATAGTYGSFNPSQGTRTVVYPLIQDRVFGYFTGISIANVGDVATTVECSFSGTSTTQTSPSLDPGEVWTDNQLNVLGNRYNGSATCTASNASAKIVGIANQLGPSQVTGGTRDNFYVYEAANN